jgi:hypothetical protein
MSRGVWAVCLAGGMLMANGGRVNAGFLDPNSFDSLGVFPAGGGLYLFNTSGAAPTLTLPDGSRINGALDSTGKIAVFAFDNVHFDQVGAILSAQGSRPLALLSRQDFIATVDTSVVIDVSSYAPDSWGEWPTAHNQIGPGGGVTSPYSHSGPMGQGSSGEAGAGGGGFGGHGGQGGPGTFTTSVLIENPPETPYFEWSEFSRDGALGGSTYGDLREHLQGGGPGGGANQGAWGAGGGAIEIGAVGNIWLGHSEILANGANGGMLGGGGSGGAILLHGKDVTVGYMSVQGGIGGSGVSWAGQYPGTIMGSGGGGGGRIFIDAETSNLPTSANLKGGAGYTHGEDGVYGWNIHPSAAVPEPASMVMAASALVAGVALSAARARDRGRNHPG